MLWEKLTMLEKEKFYRFKLIKKIAFSLQILFIILATTNISFANFQKNLLNKIAATKTLSFDFKQKIAENEENGNCFIKYSLLMKCNYKNLKQKTVISNGKSVAIIKRKYKKIYRYPIKTTPLFVILQKEKILNIIRNSNPTKVNSNIIEYEIIDKKNNKLKIFFDKTNFNLKGWETKDAYSNDVSFIISNLEINKIIEDKVFKIPREEDL